MIFSSFSVIKETLLSLARVTSTGFYAHWWMSSLYPSPHIFKYVDDLEVDGFSLPNSASLTYFQEKKTIRLSANKYLKEDVCKNNLSLISDEISLICIPLSQCWYLTKELCVRRRTVLFPSACFGEHTLMGWDTIPGLQSVISYKPLFWFSKKKWIKSLWWPELFAKQAVISPYRHWDTVVDEAGLLDA